MSFKCARLKTIDWFNKYLLTEAFFVPFTVSTRISMRLFLLKSLMISFHWHCFGILPLSVLFKMFIPSLILRVLSCIGFRMFFRCVPPSSQVHLSRSPLHFIFPLFFKCQCFWSFLPRCVILKDIGQIFSFNLLSKWF